MERSSILEIVVAPPLIIGLTEAGICSAFDMDTGRRVCVLNLSSREVIRSLFHNRSTNSLIIVVVVDSDQYTALHCRIRWAGAAFGPLARTQSDPSSPPRAFAARLVLALTPSFHSHLPAHAALSMI
jgi:hypothetical protein